MNWSIALQTAIAATALPVMTLGLLLLKKKLKGLY